MNMNPGQSADSITSAEFAQTSFSADSTKKCSFAAFGLIALTLVAFSPVYWAETIWDDDYLIFKSPHIAGTRGLQAIWIAPTTDDFFPLTYTMFWLEYRLWGKSYTGYHVVNVVLHAVAVVFIWLVLRLLKVPGAYVAAAAFAVHPVCVGSVAWIAEGKNTLSLALGAAAVWAYLKFDAEQRTGWYAASLALFALSLLAKTSLVMIPAVLLLMAWWRRDQITRIDVARTLPFFALSLALGLATIYYQHHHAIRFGNPRPEGMFSRVAAASWCLWFYFFKVVFPLGLASIYPRWSVDATAIASWLPLTSQLVVLAIAWSNRRTWGKPILFAFGYFVCILLPVLGLITMAYHSHSLVSDHLQYAAVIGPVAFVISSVYKFLSGQAVAAYKIRLAAIALIGTLGTLTWQQSSLHREPSRLWAQSLRQNNRSFAAHMNYGSALWEEGVVDEALHHMNVALQLRPGLPDLHRRLASVFLALGKVDPAIANFREALRLNPEDSHSHYNLSIALELQGDLAGAGDELREALRLRPDYAEAYNNLGKMRASQGQLEEAVTDFRRALEIDESLAEAHYNLARAMESAGKDSDAIEHLRRAVALQDRYVEAHNNLAWILATDPSERPGNTQEALTHARRASDLVNHKNPAVLDTLATAYAAAGRFEEAVATASKALQLAEDQKLPVAEPIRRRLDLFRKNQPYVAPLPTGTPPNARNR